MHRLALVCLLGISCKTPAAPPVAPGPTAAPAPAPAPADPELAEVARRLDPGPQAPLHEVLPTWLKDKVAAQLAGDPRAPARVAEAREAIVAWDKVPAGDTQALLRGALQLGRGLLLAEHALAAGASDPELLAALTKAYRLVHQLEMLQKNGLFGTVLQLAAEFAQKEGGLEGRQIEEGLAALKLAVARAPALHMHTAARLLREHPNHPTVPEVLVRAAQAKLDAEDHAEAVRLRRLAVARKGARATGSDHAGLASTCYAALDLACGDMARKTAEELGPGEPGDDKAAAFKKRLSEIDASAETARRASALAQAAGIEDGYERGQQLLKLGRYRDAEAAFTGLRARFPGDARPLTGLALLAFRNNLDYVAAAAQIRAGRGLSGRDRLYYEIGLGIVPMLVISEIATELARNPDKSASPAIPELDRRFEEVQAMAVEFRAFDPARAAVLELLFAIAREAVPKFMSEQRDAGLAIVRKVSGEALALARRFPESRDVWRLVFSSVRLIADGSKARAQAMTPLPPALQQDADIRLQQVRALIDVALMWDDRAVQAAAMQAAATLPGDLDADTAATIRATLDAMIGRQGDPAALQRALAGFTALAERKRGKEQALALSNAAVVQALLGDGPGALAHLEQAHQADREAPAVVHNTAAVAFGLQGREGLAELFAAVASGDKMPALRMHARGWLIALADAGHGDVKVTREEFAAALARETGGEFRGRLPLGRWGVVEQGEFKVSLGFTTGTGLALLDEVVPTWWLIVPAPNFDALVAAADKPGAKKKVKPR